MRGEGREGIREDRMGRVEKGVWEEGKRFERGREGREKGGQLVFWTFIRPC